MNGRRKSLKHAALTMAVLLCASGSVFGADAASLWAHKASAGDELLPVDQAFSLVSAERRDDGIDVTWSIAPGYYLYRKRLAFSAEPAGAAQALGAAQLPNGTQTHDEQGDNEIYRDTLVARLPLRAVASPARLRVRYQGCADVGVCYPPQTKLIDIVTTAVKP